MAQKFQITHINTNGTVSVLHPETNADQVVDGSINNASKIGSFLHGIFKFIGEVGGKNKVGYSKIGIRAFDG